jgi:hypothetical protein
MTTRYAQLAPWYHLLKSRCSAQTIKKTRCLNSASWKVTGTKDKEGDELEVCKPHADMLALEGYQVTKIRARRVNLQRMENQGEGRILRSVS